MGIGVVSLVYYNPDIDKFWVIDYRIFSPDHDGATKLDHLLNMLNKASIAFRVAALNLGRGQTAIAGFYKRVKDRLGAPKAITATARKLACMFYRLLKYGQDYVDHGIESYEKKYKETMVINLQKQATRLGFEVTKIEPLSEVCQEISNHQLQLVVIETYLDDLQLDIDNWLEHFNNERPHSGKYCYGKTPMQTFQDSKKLAVEKNNEILYLEYSSDSQNLTDNQVQNLQYL